MCNPRTPKHSCMEHFLKLLRDRHCSGGVAAKKLVDAALDHPSDLDGMAAQGFIEFFDFARSAPDTAEELLEQYK
jgi:hypothetical protein